MSAHKDLAPSIDIMRSLDIQAFFEKGARFDDLILLIESGYKYVEQMNEIKQMSLTISNFGVEIATVLKNAVDALSRDIQNLQAEATNANNNKKW